METVNFKFIHWTLRPPNRLTLLGLQNVAILVFLVFPITEIQFLYRITDRIDTSGLLRILLTTHIADDTEEIIIIEYPF